MTREEERVLCADPSVALRLMVSDHHNPARVEFHVICHLDLHLTSPLSYSDVCIENSLSSGKPPKGILQTSVYSVIIIHNVTYSITAAAIVV